MLFGKVRAEERKLMIKLHEYAADRGIDYFKFSEWLGKNRPENVQSKWGNYLVEDEDTACAVACEYIQYQIGKGDEDIVKGLKGTLKQKFSNPEAIEECKTVAVSNKSKTVEINADNSVAQILKAIAVVTYAGGIIAGIVLGEGRYGGLNGVIFTSFAVGGFISGTVFLGFAEIVKQLATQTELLKRLYKKN